MNNNICIGHHKMTVYNVFGVELFGTFHWIQFFKENVQGVYKSVQEAILQQIVQ